MSGRNKRAHASGPLGEARRFRQVYDFATDGGLVSTIPLRGLAVPATWLVIDGFIDIHVAFASGAATPPGSATVSVGIASVGFWNGLASTNNLVGAEALTNNWDSAIPRSLSAGNDVHGHDKTHVQLGATNALATITVAVEALTAGRFTLYLDAIPPDGYAGGAI